MMANDSTTNIMITLNDDLKRGLGAFEDLRELLCCGVGGVHGMGIRL